MIIPKVLGIGFLWYQKRIFKKKLNGESTIALIGLFHVQIQGPGRRPTTMRVILAKSAEFYYYKIFETRSQQ